MYTTGKIYCWIGTLIVIFLTRFLDLRLCLPKYEIFQKWCDQILLDKKKGFERKSSSKFKEQRQKIKNAKFHQVQEKEFWYKNKPEQSKVTMFTTYCFTYDY